MTWGALVARARGRATHLASDDALAAVDRATDRGALSAASLCRALQQGAGPEGAGEVVGLGQHPEHGQGRGVLRPGALAIGEVDDAAHAVRAEEGGLEVLHRNGQWLAVNPPAGSLVVNVGDKIGRAHV